MRDFQRDISSASRFRTELRGTDFSWSPARRRLFNKCRRAYYFHYYLTQGGWDEYAEPLIRELYMFKQLTPYRILLGDVFEAALQDSLSAISAIRGLHEERKKILMSMLLKKLSQNIYNVRSALEYPDEREPKRLQVMELFFCEEGFESIDSLISRCVNDLKKAWRLFAASELANELLELNKMELLALQDLYSFKIESFQIWFHPGIIYFRRNTAYALQIAFCDSADSAPEQSAIFHMYAERRWNKADICFRRLNFNGDEFDFCEIQPSGLSNCEIFESASEMMNMIRKDGVFHLDDFPALEDKEICMHCRFRKSCENPVFFASSI